jgi:hypothetical protein
MNYICEYKKSIPDMLCNDIIQLFEYQNDKNECSTIGGINKNIKHATDFIIPKNDKKWEKIENFLYRELSNKLKKYTKNEYKKDYTEYSIFDKKNIFTENFMIQKYDKKKENIFIIMIFILKM